MRAVGAIDSCFVSLPLSLIQSLQFGYLPPILALELRSEDRLWHVSWCGAASSSPSSIEVLCKEYHNLGLLSLFWLQHVVFFNLNFGWGLGWILQIARQYADCIGLNDRTTVKVRAISNLPKATLVTVEPLTEDDWEILELNSELAESVILKQVIPLILWLLICVSL